MFENPVIIDTGSAFIKAGVVGDEDPRVVFPTDKGLLFSPVQRGCIRDWEAMEKIWANVFSQELFLSAEEHTVLLTDTNSGGRTNMAIYFFENLYVPGLYIQDQALLSLHSVGKRTGVVLDSGAGVSRAVPIYEGVDLLHSTIRLDLGGNDIDDYLVQLMNLSGYLKMNPHRMESKGDQRMLKVATGYYRVVKEKLGYVALNFATELNKISASNSIKYKLPDYTEIEIKEERFKCAEILFNPTLIGLSESGLHHKICQSIKQSDPDIQTDLFSNIILSGGTTELEGFVPRLQVELTGIVPDKTAFQIATCHKPRYSAWVGGAILAALSTFQNACITKAEYDEEGPRVIKRKCF